MGTITQTKMSWGYEYKYQDALGHVMRVEVLDPGKKMITATENSYDATGRLIEEQHFDSEGQLRETADGFAVRRFAYSKNHDQNQMLETSYFNSNRQPVALKGGYSVLRETTREDGRLRKVELMDASRKPVPSTWLGVTNVVEAQYSYLSGATELTWAVFLDASGRVIDRRQLSGSIYSNQSYTTYQYPTYYYYTPAR